MVLTFISYEASSHHFSKSLHKMEFRHGCGVVPHGCFAIPGDSGRAERHDW